MEKLKSEQNIIQKNLEDATYDRGQLFNDVHEHVAEVQSRDEVFLTSLNNDVEAFKIVFSQLPAVEQQLLQKLPSNLQQLKSPRLTPPAQQQSLNASILAGLQAADMGKKRSSINLKADAAAQETLTPPPALEKKDSTGDLARKRSASAFVPQIKMPAPAQARPRSPSVKHISVTPSPQQDNSAMAELSAELQAKFAKHKSMQ